MFSLWGQGSVALAPAPPLPEGNQGFGLPGEWGGGGVIRKDHILSSWGLRAWEMKGWSWGDRQKGGEECKEFRMKASAHSSWLPGESTGSQAG